MCQGLVFYHLVFPFLCPNNYSVLFTFPLYSYTYEPLTNYPPPHPAQRSPEWCSAPPPAVTLTAR